MERGFATTDEPKIGALAPWFGAKRTLAPRIVQALGEHTVYWEPFAGSMAVLLAKPAASMETVNDLHGDLINLARVIQHPLEGPRFYRRLRRTWPLEGLFDEAAQAIFEPPGDDLDPDRAFRYFVASWLGRNGMAGTNVGQKPGAGHSFCVRYTANGGQPAKRWQSAVNSIPAWHRRMRGVFILRRDAFEVIAKIDDAPGVAIYVDPPYLPETRTGLNGRGGQSRYLHDFSEADHSRLADLLGRFRYARVVLSYYEAPRLTGLYPGWSRECIEVRKATANSARRGGIDARATEVLLTNTARERGADGLLF